MRNNWKKAFKKLKEQYDELEHQYNIKVIEGLFEDNALMKKQIMKLWEAINVLDSSIKNAKKDPGSL